METLNLPLPLDKEIYTAKTELGYVGCIKTAFYYCVTTERFDSALKAANAARSLKKKLTTFASPQITVDVKKKIKVAGITKNM